MVARHPAAETMIDALAVVGMKARRLLAVERAAGPVIAPARLALALVPARHARPPPAKIGRRWRISSRKASEKRMELE